MISWEKSRPNITRGDQGREEFGDIANVRTYYTRVIGSCFPTCRAVCLYCAVSGVRCVWNAKLFFVSNGNTEGIEQGMEKKSPTVC